MEKDHKLANGKTMDAGSAIDLCSPSDIKVVR